MDDLHLLYTSQFLQANETAGLSPGVHTVKYAEKCAESRKRLSDRSQLPSSKRRRPIHVLKQERAITQGAQEALKGISYQSGTYQFN